MEARDATIVVLRNKNCCAEREIDFAKRGFEISTNRQVPAKTLLDPIILSSFCVSLVYK